MSTLVDHVDLEVPPSPLVFTDAAVNKVRELITEEGNPKMKLRVFVQGGGCSGFESGFTFADVMNDDDATIARGGVQLVIDPWRFQYRLCRGWEEGRVGKEWVMRGRTKGA